MRDLFFQAAQGFAFREVHGADEGNIPDASENDNIRTIA